MVFYITETSAKSFLDKNFKKKDSSISFKFLDIFSNEAKKYYKYTDLNKFTDLEKYSKGIIAIDKDTNEYAGYVCVHDRGWTDKDNNLIIGNWINPIEVSKKFRGYGLGNELLEIAQKKYKANLLEVANDNEIALKMYKNHGWKYLTDSSSKNYIIMNRDNNYYIKRNK